MKVIGVEVRFAALEDWKVAPVTDDFREAKLVPVEVVMPQPSFGGVRHYCQVTVHTTHGDRTMQVELPTEYGTDAPKVDAFRMREFLDRQIEKGV